ncbi:translation initiation factor IF-2-like [Varanus komodoensis]|uniref:translation initiation factor IF-2-like n=1 Tax=Varanus komodoensis TaxID=61221 RepID=UPI001CF78058|nr:translation initiation factor IF-2-like [Varanus komodoensis]
MHNASRLLARRRGSLIRDSLTLSAASRNQPQHQQKQKDDLAEESLAGARSEQGLPLSQALRANKSELSSQGPRRCSSQPASQPAAKISLGPARAKPDASSDPDSRQRATRSSSKSHKSPAPPPPQRLQRLSAALGALGGGAGASRVGAFLPGPGEAEAVSVVSAASRSRSGLPSFRAAARLSSLGKGAGASQARTAGGEEAPRRPSRPEGGA